MQGENIIKWTIWTIRIRIFLYYKWTLNVKSHSKLTLSIFWLFMLQSTLMGIKLKIMNEFFKNGLLMEFWNDDMASITQKIKKGLKNYVIIISKQNF
jgi:hypothetical protein